MRKIFIFFIVFSLSAVIFSSCASSVLAHHKAKVLGVATPASELIVPPVTSGAGYILPDSPLFFLDQLKQSLRLLLAFSPDEKAMVHASVAGERLAELRIMLSRNNQEASSTTLTSLGNELTSSSKLLSEAAASGKQVDKLALELNATIKDQRNFLKELEKQADGSLQSQIEAARRVLKEAKVEVEDHLPEGELEKEMKESVEDELIDRRAQASEAAKNLTETEKTLGVPVRVPTPTPTPKSSISY